MKLNIKNYCEDKIILGTDVLNKVWAKWYVKETKGKGYTPIPEYRPPKFRNSQQVKFDWWLFEQGATVIRENKKYYLQFNRTEEATIFLLKYR